MQASLVRAFHARRPQIRQRWEALLRIEKVNTPLANPDALAFLIDWTLDEVLSALDDPPAWRVTDGADRHAACTCGRNPYLAYFAAGGQALTEGLVLAQAEAPALDPTERDAAFAALRQVVNEISRREIESFCAVCQYRAAASENHAGDHPAPTLQLEAGPCRRSR